MTKLKFLEIMGFPKEWASLGMYPDELFEIQVSGYRPGHEQSGEHYRNGAFHWWLHKEPAPEQLIVLTGLSMLDPDQLMAGDIRNYIVKSKKSTSAVRKACGIAT